MAQFFAANATKVFNTNPPVKVSPSGRGGEVRVLTDTVTYAAQASGDTIVVGGGKLPLGAVVLGGFLTTSVTTGSATLAVGISGTAAKYKAAAAVTTTDVPQWFGIASGALGDGITAEEQILLTIGGASLPGSGTLDFVLLYVLN